MNHRFSRLCSLGAGNAGWVLLLFAASSALAQQSSKFSISFKERSYRVEGNTVLKTKIVIDPVPDRSFFSYGILVQITGAEGIAGVVNVTPTKRYDFDGPMGAGAVVSAIDNSGGIKGTLDFFNPAVPPSSAKKLAKLTIQPLPPGKYKLKLLPYRTLGATEQLFVRGKKEVPDDQVQLGTAKLRVLAAPIGTNSQSLLGSDTRKLPAEMILPQTALSTIPTKSSVKGLASVASIRPAFSMVNGKYVLEFSTQSNVVYHVQYSSDLVNWKDAQPAIFGTGTRQQWIDSGPPGTEVTPQEVKARFYRFVVTDESAK